MTREGIAGSLNLGSVDLWGWVIWGCEGLSGVLLGVDQRPWLPPPRCHMPFLP